MQRILIYFLLLGLGSEGMTQTSIQPVGTSTVTKSNARWDLDRNVWSHTHYKAGKNDKPVIDFNAIENWYGIGADKDVSISADGKYFAYQLVNKPYQGSTLVVQSTDKAHSWSKSYINAKAGFFSADGKKYIFQNDSDDLCLLKVGSNDMQVIQDVSTYQVSNKGNGKWIGCLQKNTKSTLLLLYLVNGAKLQLDEIANFKFDPSGDKVAICDKSGLILFDLKKGRGKTFSGVSKYAFDKSGQWLACQVKSQKSSDDPGDLLVYNLVTGFEERYPSVKDYLFDPLGNGILLKVVENGINNSLLYINILKKELSTLWIANSKFADIANYNFDITGKQVCFSVSNQDSSFNNTKNNSIWYWKDGMDRGKQLVDKSTTGIGENMYIENDCSFFDNNIVFSLQKIVPKIALMTDPVEVDVWSYKDKVLQSTQQNPKGSLKAYACINLEASRVILLSNEHETLRDIGSDFALVENNLDAICGDQYWEKDNKKDTMWIVNLHSGRRELLSGGQKVKLWNPRGSQYRLYFDLANGCNYYSLSLQTGKRINISSTVPPCLFGVEDFYVRNPSKPRSAMGLAAWLPSNTGVLVYDNYDIWQLDLSGKELPINITNGYGRRNKIIFSLVGRGEDGQHNLAGIPTLTNHTSLLLKSFNRTNKQYGVYQKALGPKGDPELLYSGDCELSLIPISNTENHFEFLADWAIKPIKAFKTKRWIVIRQSATDAPNYFLTSDFKTYRRLTNLQPQKAYNWLTAELHDYKLLDGTMGQGLLYKPENFDPTRKYPVIINFYRDLTSLLNRFPIPGYLTRPSFFENPAWLVSHGYIVFLPDVYFTLGHWGPSVLNAIDGSAKYLRTLPYVDSQHLAACGHSNSGTFGYYVLTHSNSFAAMSIGAGTTDIISAGFQLSKSGSGSLEWVERTQFGTALAGHLWEDKTNWLDHLSVLHADKVTSPLLIFHCKNDGVRFNQAEEMFTSLWRLGKPVWLLQYDNGGHLLFHSSDRKDFTIRTTQFYDHYLKGAPAPRWMSEGIPSKLKGIESRYDLDPQGN